MLWESLYRIHIFGTLMTSTLEWKLVLVGSFTHLLDILVMISCCIVVLLLVFLVIAKKLFISLLMNSWMHICVSFGKMCIACEFGHMVEFLLCAHVDVGKMCYDGYN
jgi:hypothetical protein